MNYDMEAMSTQIASTQRTKLRRNLSINTEDTIEIVKSLNRSLIAHQPSIYEAIHVPYRYLIRCRPTVAYNL
jgi:hypothetical protein